MLILNRPLGSVTVPSVVPLKITATPGKSIPCLSFTTPEIRCCEIWAFAFSCFFFKIMILSFIVYVKPKGVRHTFNAESNDTFFTFTEIVLLISISLELYMKSYFVWFLISFKIVGKLAFFSDRLNFVSSVVALADNMGRSMASETSENLKKFHSFPIQLFL